MPRIPNSPAGIPTINYICQARYRLVTAPTNCYLSSYRPPASLSLCFRDLFSFGPLKQNVLKCRSSHRSYLPFPSRDSWTYLHLIAHPHSSHPTSDKLSLAETIESIQHGRTRANGLAWSRRYFISCLFLYQKGFCGTNRAIIIQAREISATIRRSMSSPVQSSPVSFSNAIPTNETRQLLTTRCLSDTSMARSSARACTVTRAMAPTLPA